MRGGLWRRSWNSYGRLGLGRRTSSPFHSCLLPDTGKSPHPGSLLLAGGGNHWGALEPRYPRSLPRETGPSKLLCDLCSEDRGEGPEQCESFGKGLMRQGGGEGNHSWFLEAGKLWQETCLPVSILAVGVVSWGLPYSSAPVASQSWP